MSITRICPWDIVSEPPVLKKHGAHIWCSTLDFSEKKSAAFFETLSDTEKQRARRFHFAHDRAHFVAARGLLRKILSTYLHCKPHHLRFNYNSYGKPVLTDYSNLQFNVSHSKGFALYGVSYEPAIGVDIEFIQANRDIDAITRRYFSADEYDTIKNITGTEKIQAFFNGWVRKEAFLKALGAGLSFPLAHVEVTLKSAEPAKFIALHDKKLDIAEWSLQALNPLLNYAAAVVVKGKLQQIKTGYWSI